MTNLDNITRIGTIISVRETEFRVINTKEGVDYRYTEIHSDGVRAIKVRMERYADVRDSSVAVWFARVETVGDETMLLWNPLPAVTSPASAWHGMTKAYSQHTAPTMASTVLNELVSRAIVALVWDGE